AAGLDGLTGRGGHAGGRLGGDRGGVVEHDQLPLPGLDHRAAQRSSALRTAWPPKALRSAASMRSAEGAVSRERKRTKSDEVMVQAGTSWSIASSTVQRPSPESSTYPLIFSSRGSCSSALAPSSRSHERTTLPCCQSLAIRGRSRLNGLLCMSSNPSA